MKLNKIVFSFFVLLMSIVGIIFAAFNISIDNGLSAKAERSYEQELDIFESGLYCEKSGQIYLANGVNFTLDAGKIYGGIAYKGGAIYVSSGATLTVNGGSIYSSSAVYGGAIYVEAGGKLYLNCGNIYGNRAQFYTNDCPAIYAEDADNDVIIGEDFTFGENEAVVYSTTINFYVDGSLVKSMEWFGATYTIDESHSLVPFENCCGYFLDSACTKSAHKGAITLQENKSELNLYTQTATLNGLYFYPVGEGYGVLSATGASLAEDLVLPAEYRNQPVVQTYSNGDNVNRGAFYSKNIKSVQFPAMMTKIDKNSFYGSRLTSVYTTNVLTEIGASAFENCANLVLFNGGDVLKFYTGTTIGERTFYNTKVKKVNLQNVDECGNSAFASCKSLTTITFGSLIETSESMFANCTSLSKDNISWGTNLKEIGDYSFFNCTGITAGLSLPSSVTAIGDFAFSGTNIVAATIPTTIETMGTNPFYNCKKLNVISVSSNYFISKFNGTLLCSKDETRVVSTTINFSTAVNKPELYLCSKVTVVDDYVFYGVTNLNFNVISNKLQTIGNYSFFGSNITTLALTSESVTIGENAFENCVNLTALYINTDSISKQAFKGCTSLTDANLGSHLENLGQSAFEGCSSLTKVQMSSINNLVVNLRAFAGCEQMETIYFSANVSTIIADIVTNSPF